jgi:glycosidase
MRPKPLLLLAVVLFFAQHANSLPTDTNLSLDPTYGLFPRPQGHAYFPSPQDWRDINIYQLFTDRFADGDSANNTSKAMGIDRTNWFVSNSGRSFPHNRNFHHGGDWKGLLQNLDYLTGMGVNAVWISGVQMNAQGRDGRYTPYHQYHPTDFFNVDPAQGTFQELKDLIDACHARGIYVILDVVINHTADLTGLSNVNDDRQYWANGGPNFGWWDSRRHPYPFNELRWFHNNGTINNWDAFPETLRGQFRGTDDLATDSGHVTYWITEAFKNLIDATDCDGFRVDAIKHVEYNWVKKWADDIRKHAASKGKNDFILFGELFVYDNNALASYCREVGYSFNSALFFPMSQTIKGVFIDGAGTGQLTQQLSNKAQYGEGENRLVTFIDNHDVNRISLENGGDTGNDIWKLRPALSFLYLATPVPCLYYGTEHAFNQGNHRNGTNASQDGYEGQPFDDADWQRETMFDRGFQPGPAQGNKLAETNAPLYQHIKALNAARKAHPALTRGSFTERWQSGSAGPYAFTRVLQDQEALVAFNTGDNQSATINPQVNKPNGTEFTNVLNPSEKLTVSGGRLNFSLAGKDTKIFVAGSFSKPSEARATSDATNVTITYTPNDGPLKSATAPVQIGVRIDGGTEQFFTMTAGPNGVWTYSRPYAGITSNLTVAFRDSATIPVVDRTGGAAWTFDATKFGQSLVTWIGNTVTFPPQGNITASNDLWIDIEAFPKDTAAGGKVLFTTNNGTSWNEVPLAKARVVGNNDLLNANLGKFPGGTALKFAVQVVDTNGVARWDNNNGTDYTRTVQFGTLAIGWSGRVNHWPLDGTIESTSELWINVESWPQNAGIGGEVVYSTNNGTSWQSKPLAFRIAQENNDFWNCNLGTFPAGTKVRYAVKLTDTTGADHWHNNSGADFAATVNGTASSLITVGTPQARGQSPAERPKVGLRFTGNGSLVMDADNRNAANTYTIEQSENLSSWTTLRTIPAGNQSAVWDLLNSGNLTGKLKGFFRVRAAGGESEQVFENNPARISITANQNGAKSANIVYTTDGGATWLNSSLTKTGTQNGTDTWSVDLAGLPRGSAFQYAIELVDQQNASRWMNNGGVNYNAPVIRPGQTDFAPPTASHSPSVTTVAAATMNITLSSTDAIDPSPKIYYTVDGSTPSTLGILYTGPIPVTNTNNNGVDMVVRYFAIDAEGNRSPLQSVEVNVGQTQNFGPDKPYSTNPSLGKSVANGGIAIDGANTANEWTDDKLIALGMANDDPRSLGSNWTMHEAPLNITHIWAAWDDNNLYLAWQFVDVTDVIDGANAGGAGSGRIGSNDGILQWIALDTKPDQGATLDMWGKNANKQNVAQPLWTGTNKPDFQLYLAGSLWQGFISRAVNNAFPVDDNGVNYFKILGGGSATQLGFQAGKGALFAGTSLWGVDDADARRATGAPTRNFMTQGHNGARDSFYEIKIPLNFLGLTKAQLESQGLGVMIGAGSASTLDALPQDDGATLNTQGVEAWNSPLEWGDVDNITAPFARVGAW